MCAVIFMDMIMYVLTEGRNFKTFLKENYATALDSCYLLIYYKYVEYGIEYDIDSAYRLCIH